MKVKLLGEQVIEIDGITFKIRPRKYMDIVSARSKLNTSNIEHEVSRGYGFLVVDMMERITSWEGITQENGEPAPCNDQYKDALFSQNPLMISKLINIYHEKEAAELKNSETSQNGNSTDQTPASAKPAEQ